MKNRIIVFLLICIYFILSIGCKKTNKSCIYEEINYSDTSFYIEFNEEGVYRKYYQLYPWASTGSDGYSQNSSNGIFIDRNVCHFDFSKSKEISKLSEMGVLKIDVTLSFYKWKQLHAVVEANDFKVTPYEIFRDTLVATTTIGSSDINKMKLMDGYSLTLEDGLSIDNVFSDYSNQQEVIKSYFSNTCFRTTKIESTCNNYYLIEGSFTTKLGRYSGLLQKFVSSSITNGKFRILRRFV